MQTEQKEKKDKKSEKRTSESEEAAETCEACWVIYSSINRRDERERHTLWWVGIEWAMVGGGGGLRRDEDCPWKLGNGKRDAGPTITRYGQKQSSPESRFIL